ncbi:hypothetical protein [Klebsiella michiganensis]|nr:hypothetical protein [Klebsiella michiganensis]
MKRDKIMAKILRGVDITMYYFKNKEQSKYIGEIFRLSYPSILP